jgi:hypothetical protein
MPLICPVCNTGDFLLKHEASYIYSYRIDSKRRTLNGLDSSDKLKLLPFMYDKREQKNSWQYLECSRCGSKYPCFFDESDGVVSCKALQDAVNADETGDGSLS